MLEPPAPSTLVQQLSWLTSAGNAAPVSCGCRSRTDFATTASTTVTDGVAAAGAGAGAGAGAAALVVSCAASPRPRSRVDAAIIAMRFMTALLQRVSLVRHAGGDVQARCPALPQSRSRPPPLRAGTSPGTRAAVRRTYRRTARPPWRRTTPG